MYICFIEDRQRKLNDAVLDVLRSGDIKRLQSLPTIGPKTAAILRTHQLVHLCLRLLPPVKFM